MRIINSGIQENLKEIVLFSFDNIMIPLQHGLRLQLNPYCHSVDNKSNIVMGLGEPGTPDDRVVTLYGTVRKVGEELWMWYCGGSSFDDNWHERICLAKSSDGRLWEKPNLGLVEFNGNRNNNLVSFPIKEHVQALVVFYEPEELDPSRRFKMSFQTKKYKSGMGIAFSHDGLSWELFSDHALTPFLEQSGGTKFNGVYYINGQGGKHWSANDNFSRKLVTHMSYDFIDWTEAASLGFRRDSISPAPTNYGSNSGKQVHLGAALWNRGNTVLGFYGKWNGHPSQDRRLTWMDLGLIISHDCLHFYEPIPDFPIVQASETNWYPIGSEGPRFLKDRPGGDSIVYYPAIIQGQGFENIGNETLFWYAPWPEGDADGIRLATWPRDRLGFLSPYVGPDEDSFMISQPLSLGGKSARVYLNIDGIGELAHVKVEVLNERFEPITGYSAKEHTDNLDPGFRQHVLWSGLDSVSSDIPIRIRINFKGVRPEDIRLYAIYLEQ